MSASLRYPARHGCFTEKRTLAEFPKNIRKILAVRFGRLGDVILLLPSLHELKSCFPGASLTFVTDHRHAPLAELCPFIDRVIPLNRLAMRDGQKAAALMAMWRLLCSLRDLHCDLAVDFHGFGESNLLTWLSRATHRVGLKKSNQTYYQFCFNTPPVIEDKNLHVADMFRRVVHAIPGVTPRGSQLAKVLIVQDSVKERIRSIAVNSPLMTLFVGARAADHLWPAARFARLADLMVERFGASVMVATGTGDFEAGLAQTVRATARNRDRIWSLGAIEISDLVGIIASSKLLVSNDTGPMHIGPAVGVPTLGLFSLSSPQHYRPVGPASEYLIGNPIEKIELEEVFETAQRMLTYRSGPIISAIDVPAG